MHSECTANGAAALEHLHDAARRGVTYDLAILDMHMPEMDGLTLARKIKSDAALASTRLLLLTSLADRLDAGESGILQCLTKPVRRSQLHDALAVAMGAAAPQPRPVDKPSASPPARQPAVPCRTRILVAEDNAVNQKVAARMLEKLGYRADVVANGLEAVDALSRISYAAVLMDCHMPELDGYEATALIRKREASGGQHTPVIAMTANLLEGNRERCLAAGMDDYIAKPVQIDDLAAAVERAVRSSGVAKAPISFDREQALARLNNDEHLLQEIAALFLRDCPRLLDDIRAAVGSGNAVALERAAHALKGALGNFGASPAHDAALALERAGRRGQIDDAGNVCHRLEKELAQLAQALANVRAGEETPA
jgi:CheY-like chemotaxis protein